MEGFQGCYLVVHLVSLTVVLHLHLVTRTAQAAQPTMTEPLTQEVHGDSGYFLSPNYPQKYPENQNLTYTAHLNTPGPLIVQIRLDIDLESTGTACYDYVKIHSTKYCGSGTATREIRINGTEFVMLFFSDDRIEKTGFNVSFSVLEVISPETLLQATTTVPNEHLATLPSSDFTADSVTSDSIPGTPVVDTAFSVTLGDFTPDESSDVVDTAFSVTLGDFTSDESSDVVDTAFSVTLGDFTPDESSDLDSGYTKKRESSQTEPVSDRTSTSANIPVTMSDLTERTKTEEITVVTSDAKSTLSATDGPQDGEAVDEGITHTHVSDIPTTELHVEETVSPSFEDVTTAEQLTEGTTLQRDVTEFTTAGQVPNKTTPSQNVDEHTTSRRSTDETTLSQDITSTTRQSTDAGTNVDQDVTTYPTVAQQLTEQTTSSQHDTTATTGQPAAESTPGQSGFDTSTEQLSQDTTLQGFFQTSTVVQHTEQITTAEETAEQSTVGQQTAQPTLSHDSTQTDQPTQQTSEPSMDEPTSEETSVPEDVTSSTTITHANATRVEVNTSLTTSEESLTTPTQPTDSASVTQSGVTSLNPTTTTVQTPSQTTVTNDVISRKVRPPKLSLSQKSCRCVPAITAAKQPAMMQQKRDEMAVIVKSLIIKKDNISATRRRLVSASDDRSSSKVMGAMGIVLCVLPVLFMLLTDLLGLFTRHQEHSCDVYVHHQR